MGLGQLWAVLVRFCPIRSYLFLLIPVEITGLGRIHNVNIAECNMTLSCNATTNNSAAPEGMFVLPLQPPIKLTVHFLPKQI